jgi:hypothetical protein
MNDDRITRSPRPDASSASQDDEIRRVLPTLPLGGAAFSPPLSARTDDRAARQRKQAALLLVTSAAFVSCAAVAIALVVGAGRSTARPAQTVRPLSDAAARHAPTPGFARSPSGRRSPLPSTRGHGAQARSPRPAMRPQPTPPPRAPAATLSPRPFRWSEAREPLARPTCGTSGLRGAWSSATHGEPSAQCRPDRSCRCSRAGRR